MVNIMKVQFTLLVFILSCSSMHGQILKDLNIKYMLRGHFYAKSSIVDQSALGGFGGSNNSAQKVKSDLLPGETGLILHIDTAQIVPFAKEYKGYPFFIVNKADSALKLEASDSRLNVIGEAFIEDKWQPFEYLPRSWCGNSYHSVYLQQDEYWEFVIPKFVGKIETLVRYCLILENGENIYSNEIKATINQQQLTNKNEYRPNGIMDPYVD